MAGMLPSKWWSRLAIWYFALLFSVFTPSLAHAGSYYECDPGEVHQFLGCVNPEKPPPQPCQPTAGNPVDVLTGRKHQEVLDWSSGGQHPLELRRHFSSSPFTLASSPYSSIGRAWRTNFDARARWNGATLDQATWVHVVLPDHFEYHFNKQAGVWRTMVPLLDGTTNRMNSVAWRTRSDLDVSLSIDGEWIVFRTPGDVVYVFDSAEHKPELQYRSDGFHTSVLSEIRYRGGYAQRVAYSGDHAVRVADNLGRWLEFDYSRPGSFSNLISRVRTSDGKILKYGYQNRFLALDTAATIDFWALSSVTYPDATTNDDADNPKVTYEYLDAVGKPGLLLKGIVDERGVRFASWTYDSRGRALSSEHAGGADRWQFAYDDAASAVTVTNPSGRATKYTYRKVVGALRQLVAVDGIATSNCAASNTQYNYDAKGFRNRAVDAEGRVTEWTRDVRGLPLGMTEGLGNASQRSTTMTWEAASALPLTIGRPGLESRFAYSQRQLINSAIQTDTSSLTLPYVTAGQKRTTSYAYAPFQGASPLPPAPTGSQLQTVSLPIVNPDASRGSEGWISTTGSLAVRVSSPCSSADPCFYGGAASWLIAHQDIPIPSTNIPEVDRGQRAAKIAWSQNGWSSTDDYAAVDVLFLDAKGSIVGNVISPLEIRTSWAVRSRTAPIPVGARVIRVVLLNKRKSGSNNDGYIDNLLLSLVPDGKAASDPFLTVVNDSALYGTGVGWSLVDPASVAGAGGSIAVEATLPCSFCTYFRNSDRVSGNSMVSQDLMVPADRYQEIDSGRRGLELDWFSYSSHQLGQVILTVAFLDSTGKILDGPARGMPSASNTATFVNNLLFVPKIPPKTRKVKVVFQTIFPPPPSGNRTAAWYGLTAKLVPSVTLPSSSTDLLTSIDGPLPGPSDTVRYGYDASGTLTSVTNELGHVTRITRLDAGGRPLGITDPNGVVTNLAYDARGRLTVVNVNPGTAQARTAIAYDAAGQVTRVTAPDGSYLQYTWSDARRLTSVSNNGGERIDYAHDAMGNVTSRTVKSGSGVIIRQQSALFDELGRLMRAIGAAGQQTLFSYDRTDNLTSVQDPRGGLFAYAYDGLQRLAAATDQTNAATTLARDASDGVTAYRDSRGLTTTYVRNGFGEVIQESGPDLGTTVIVRDERGLPTRITDPRGVVTTLAYDAAGRLVKEAYPADPAQNVTYVYDDTTNGNKGVGRLTGIIDGSGRMARGYDALGRIVAEAREIAGKTYSTSYAYNAAGRLTAITYPSGRLVNYARNGLGRVTTITSKPSATAPAVTVASGFAWAPMSTSLNGFTHGNGLATTRAYDRDGRLAALKLSNGTTRLMDLAYAYGDGMNLTAVNDNVTAANSVVLAYDAAQRLASARGPWGSLAYDYTPVGDRARETLTLPGGSPLVTQLDYPANSNRLAKSSVAGIATRSFSYDAAGNTVTEQRGPERLSFAYNVRNRPVTVTRSGTGATQTTRYAFNALEQMVQRSTTAPGGPAGTVHYIHGLDGELLAEADGATGAITREYIWLPVDDVSPAADNDNEEGAQTPPLPLGLVTGVNTPAPALLMVHADHLGRPVRLTDATRATVWAASYDPFGQPWQVTGAIEQNLRFPGQYFLLESGLSYNWHRFYDASTGRYTQPDPLRFVDGPSVYGYAGASPMMRVDSTGLSPLAVPALLCRIYPSLCASAGATIIYGVWNGCYWVFRKGFSGGGGGGGDDGDDNDNKCKVIKEACIEHCTMAIDNVALPDLQSTNYRRCINQCLYDNNCGGNDYSDGWDNGKLGTPKPWGN